MILNKAASRNLVYLAVKPGEKIQFLDGSVGIVDQVNVEWSNDFLEWAEVVIVPGKIGRIIYPIDIYQATSTRFKRDFDGADLVQTWGSFYGRE